MGNAPRDEDGYLRAVGETLTEWSSPEDEDAWRDEALGEQRAASELGLPPREPPRLGGGAGDDGDRSRA